MVKPMKLRDVERALRAAKCRSDKGTNHAVWRCPCGAHSTAVPRHTNVSPGVLRNIVRDLACLPKGWL
jgi:hypothetical protein